MHEPDPAASPLNPLPRVVVFLAVLIAGIELLFSGAEAGLFGGPGAIGWRMGAIEHWGVADGVAEWMWANGRLPPRELARLLAYPLIHYSFTHALFVVVFVLALGKMVGEIFRPAAVLAVFWGASVAGALAYVALLDARMILAGGYPGVYGLIGAFSYILWMRLGAVGAARWRAFSLIGMLLAIQLLFAVLFGGSPDWIADLAGFGAGFGLSFLVSPGGPARLRAVLARVRQR